MSKLTVEVKENTFNPETQRAETKCKVFDESGNDVTKQVQKRTKKTRMEGEYLVGQVDVLKGLEDTDLSAPERKAAPAPQEPETTPEPTVEETVETPKEDTPQEENQEETPQETVEETPAPKPKAKRGRKKKQ